MTFDIYIDAVIWLFIILIARLAYIGYLDPPVLREDQDPADYDTFVRKYDDE